jgi:hypothetical protein
MSKVIEELSERYLFKDRNKLEEDLIRLMLEENTNKIFFHYFTPSFNDGDPCILTIPYISKEKTYEGQILTSDEEFNNEIEDFWASSITEELELKEKIRQQLRRNDLNISNKLKSILQNYIDTDISSEKLRDQLESLSEFKYPKKF